MKGKFRLIICESITGIILNEELNYFTNDGAEKPDFYFDSLDEVKEFIDSKNKGNIFYEVFDDFGDLIFHFHP